jgi:hypothetical protein
MQLELNDSEVKLIERMRAFKLSRHSKLERIMEILESPSIKPLVYEYIHNAERKYLAMHARML